MLRSEAERLLPYAPGALFDLAADVEQYPRYLAGWISARVYERTADTYYAEQVVGIGWARVRFRSQARLHRPQRIEVTSDDRRFRRFRLLWRFSSDGHRDCRVVLSVEVELISRLLQRWLDRLAPPAQEILIAFDQHASQLLGPAPLPRR